MSLAKEKIPILSAAKMPIYFAFQKRKKRKVFGSWEVLLFHLFRLHLGGLSVCIDNWFSEINSALYVGHLNRVIWKEPAAYHSIFRSGLSWQAIWDKLFWLCYRNCPAEAGSVLQLAGVTSVWASLTWLAMCVHRAELGGRGTKAAVGWQQPSEGIHWLLQSCSVWLAWSFCPEHCPALGISDG